MMQEAVIVGHVMTLRMELVILAAIFFVSFGGHQSGQRVMLLTLTTCSLRSFVFCGHSQLYLFGNAKFDNLPVFLSLTPILNI